MDILFFLYSIFCLFIAVGYHKFNKWSLKGRDGNKNPDIYSKDFTNLQIITSWTIVAGFIIAALVNFLKGIGI